MNAIMEDVITGDIKDYFNGIEDIKNKVIRVVDEDTFKEDSLRVYRMAQFASRFNFRIEERSKHIAKGMDVRELSIERVNEEFRKGLVKSKRSEEHTSELQSRFDLVCRLLLEKKNLATVHDRAE